MATRRHNTPTLYLLLSAVALASVFFHFRSVEQIFPHWFGIDRANWPFLLEAEDKPQFLLTFLRQTAQKAGLQEGDRLIAINGVPVRSRSIFADLLSASKPGSAWRVLYRRGSQTMKRSAKVFLQRTETNNDPIAILLFAAMPAFCLALAFWTVSVRLHDVRA